MNIGVPLFVGPSALYQGVLVCAHRDEATAFAT